MEYQYHTLPNGIRIVHKQVKGAVAHCGVLINTGSRDELPQEQGMAHFIEHVIFKGTKKRKVYHIMSRLDNVGGDLNAYTTKEETCVYASFLKSYYDRSLELMSDILFNSTFPAAELEKEKDVIVEEIQSYKDAPSEQIFDDFEDQIFAGHPMGRNILGTPKNIRRFTRDDVMQFIQNNYHTDQIVISSVGAIAMQRLIALCEKYFGIRQQNLRQQPRASFKNYQPNRQDVTRQTYQTHTVIGNIAPAVNHPHKLAMTILNNVLGGPGLNSRLNLAIREKYGFTYSIESNYQPYSDTGLFAVYMGTDNGSYERAIELVMQELNKLRNIPLGTIQMHTARKQFIGQLAIAFESNLSEMLSIGKSYMMMNSVDNLKTINAKVGKVTAQQLTEIANEVFKPEQQSILIFKKR